MIPFCRNGQCHFCSFWNRCPFFRRWIISQISLFNCPRIWNYFIGRIKIEYFSLLQRFTRAMDNWSGHLFSGIFGWLERPPAHKEKQKCLLIRAGLSQLLFLKLLIAEIHVLDLDNYWHSGTSPMNNVYIIPVFIDFF